MDVFNRKIVYKWAIYTMAMLNNKRVCHLDLSPLWKAKWLLARDSSLESWMTITEMTTGDAHFKKPVGNLWFLDGLRYWPIATWSMSCIWPSPSGCGNQSMVVVGDEGKTKTRKSNHVYNTKKALFWLKTPKQIGETYQDLIMFWTSKACPFHAQELMQLSRFGSFKVITKTPSPAWAVSSVVKRICRNGPPKWVSWSRLSMGFMVDIFYVYVCIYIILYIYNI